MARQAVILPQLGEAVAEATIHTWHVALETTIERDQVVAEVETEKAVLEITAPCAGILVDRVVPEGEQARVGDIIAWIDDGEAEELPRPAAGRQQRPGPTAPRSSEEAAEPAQISARSGAGFLSPRVRQLMAEHGITTSDLYQVRATGDGNRVRAEDIERFLQRLDDHYDAHPTTGLRRMVGSAMQRSWQRPLATVAARVGMDALLAHRRGIPGRPSASAYAIRALALALREVPSAAQILVGDRHHVPRHFDIGFAVEADDGVLSPIVRDADTLGLSALAERMAELTRRARERRLDTDHLRPGIATVSDYGSLGITWATPLPLETQSLIFGIGAVQRLPAWNPARHTWGAERASEVTLTFDHRTVDGGGSSRLLRAIVKYLEHPERLD